MNDFLRFVDIDRVPTPTGSKVVNVDAVDPSSASDRLKEKAFGSSVDPTEPAKGPVIALEAPVAAIFSGRSHLLGQGGP